MSAEHRKLNRKRWALVRWQVLERDQWRCQARLVSGEVCLRPGRLQVDHIKALKLGGGAIRHGKFTGHLREMPLGQDCFGELHTQP